MMPGHREGGFSLVTLIIFVMALTIGLAAAAPNYQILVQRELEEELIFRGEEYVRAIQKYQRRFGVYPPSVDGLLETNGIRFLRRAYVDPITGEPFRLLTATPTGGIEGSLLYSETATPLLGGGLGGSPSGAGESGPAEASRDRRTEFSEESVSRSSGFGFQSGFGESSAFGATAPGSPSSSASSFESTFQRSRIPGSNDSSNFVGTFSSSSQAQPATRSAFTGRSGPANAFSQAPFNGSTGNAAASEPEEGGAGLSGVVGVAPTNDAPSLKAYNGRENYMEWEFVALPRQMGQSRAARSDGDTGGAAPPPAFTQD